MSQIWRRLMPASKGWLKNLLVWEDVAAVREQNWTNLGDWGMPSSMFLDSHSPNGIRASTYEIGRRCITALLAQLTTKGNHYWGVPSSANQWIGNNWSSTYQNPKFEILSLLQPNSARHAQDNNTGNISITQYLGAFANHCCSGKAINITNFCVCVCSRARGRVRGSACM